MSPEDAVALLTEGDIEPLGLLPRASNYTFLVRVSKADSTALAVYKPRDGEAPLWDFPDGTLYLREVAAFALATAMGFPNIPLTVVREGPHGAGSLQLFIEANVREHYFTLRERRRSDFEAVAAFDVVVNNADRKSGHCLMGADGRIWVVDHGVCFNVVPKLRTVIWDFAGEPVPGPLVEGLARVAGELRSGPLGTRMRTLLSPEEIEASARRAERLARAGQFPEPRGDRPYPWPPV